MILMVATGLTVIITVALIYGSRRWESATKEMHAKLEAARRPPLQKTQRWATRLANAGTLDYLRLAR
jgi:hypothetical protein